jgi:hypothetical protein
MIIVPHVFIAVLICNLVLICLVNIVTDYLFQTSNRYTLMMEGNLITTTVAISVATGTNVGYAV